MLEVSHLQVDYGKVQAVRDLSLSVAQGEIVALVGANGAGKSSTLQAIVGIVKPTGGEIRFRGGAITDLPSHHVVRRGIMQVPEGRLIFGGLTVEENLRLGAHTAKHRADLTARIDHALELFPALRDRLSDQGAALSGGQAQLLALARAMMADPDLLLLDEPSLGLAPLAAREVFALIGRLREQGKTIVLVEQNVRQALSIADRGYVMEGGRIILEGAAGDLIDDELLVSSYLGV